MKVSIAMVASQTGGLVELHFFEGVKCQKCRKEKVTLLMGDDRGEMTYLCQGCLAELFKYAVHPPEE